VEADSVVAGAVALVGSEARVDRAAAVEALEDQAVKSPATVISAIGSTEAAIPFAAW